MAAFSYQHQPTLLDSVFFPDSSSSSPIKMPSNLLEQHMDYIAASSFTYFPSVSLHGCCTSALENQAATFSSVEHKADSSSLPLELENGGGNLLHHQQSDMIMDKKRKNKCVSWFKDAEYSKDPEETQSKRQKKYCNGSFKEREEKKPKACKKSVLKNSCDGEPPSGYIHVRARRGEATDSHSLAERVRREKISERMRILQGLVPGCNKVSGKALILDEIINYVRSLQNQVEFLSMKLACINPAPLSHFASVDIEDPIDESEKMRSIASQLSSIQNTVANSYYPLMESATSILPRPQSPNETFSQDNAKLLWNREEQRQQFLNSSAFANLCTF